MTLKFFYKPGKENLVVDALIQQDPPQLLVLSSTNPMWLSELHTFYTTVEGQTLIN